ncbi:hypothetical protein Misp05_16590 [Micromonospora sp. NBRC 107095]|nr:hypothetical protein Misp05_16590 [Micromonospora sp. NBRC 107095]
MRKVERSLRNIAMTLPGSGREVRHPGVGNLGTLLTVGERSTAACDVGGRLGITQSSVSALGLDRWEPGQPAGGGAGRSGWQTGHQ